MRFNCFVYLSGPITAREGHSVEQNVAAALDVYWRLLQYGIPAFCPHLSAGFPTAFTAIDYETWLRYDYAVLDRCTHVLMLPRWETSTGAVLELAYADKRGLPVAKSETELIEMLTQQLEVAHG